MIAEDEKILFISNARVIALSKTVLSASQRKVGAEHWVCGEENSADDTEVPDI